jgi:hypothetical protein
MPGSISTASLNFDVGSPTIRQAVDNAVYDLEADVLSQLFDLQQKLSWRCR